MSLQCPVEKFRCIQQEGLELSAVWESRARKPPPHSARLGERPVSRQVCLGRSHAGRPHFAHFPCEVEHGPAHRCSDRETRGVVVHTVPP